jgi:hypothetical protein
MDRGPPAGDLPPRSPDGGRAGPSWWSLAAAALVAAAAVAFVVAAIAVDEPDPLVLAGLAAVPSAVGFLVGRCTVRWDDQEVVVRNPVRTHRIPLAEVRSVDFPPLLSRLRPMLIERTDYRIVRVTAVQNDGWWNRGRAERIAEALRDDVARARGRALPRP